MYRSQSLLARAAAALASCAVAAEAQTYVAVDLGALPGTTSTFAQRVNESGQVAGYCQDAANTPFGFLWTDGMMTPITATGWTNVTPYDLDDLGRVVGEGVNPSGETHGFLWSAATGIQDLGTLTGLPGASSIAWKINHRGTIAGAGSTMAGPSHALRSTSGPWVDLGTLAGGANSSARAANDGGWVGGYSYDGSAVQNPVVWNSGGTITDLAPTAGDAGFVNDLNEIAACGYATSAAYPAGVAHRWVLGGAAGILGTLAPGKRSDARAINASDVVVGTAQDGSNVSRAFRWRASDGMKDLNTLYASGTQYFLLNASAISDGGQIVGSTYTTQPASVLLTPSGCFATLRPIGAEIGGTVSFRYSSPCHPGLVGVTFVSLTGAALTLPLPGGVSIKLTPDAFMYKFFALTFLSMVTLDGTGVGTTAGLPIPNNPLIVGLPMWAAGAIYDLAQSKFVAATSTNAWVLLP